MTTLTTTAPTAEKLTQVAIDRIIEQATKLAKDSSLNLWRDIYEPAKWAIAEFGPSADEYSRAVQALAEALGI